MPAKKTLVTLAIAATILTVALTLQFGGDSTALGEEPQQYAGSKNRPTLIKLLSPVQEAAKRCEWV